jgi:hypothetical protein
VHLTGQALDTGRISPQEPLGEGSSRGRLRGTVLSLGTGRG